MRKESFLRGKWLSLRSVLWVGATFGLAVGAYFLAQPLTLERLARAQVKTTPFTLQLESYDLSEGSPGLLFSKETVARRSDGATVRINSMGGLVGLQSGEAERHIVFLDGREIAAFDGVSSVIRFPKLSTEAISIQKQKILNPPANCLFPGQTLVRYEALQGYTTAVVRVGPVGQNEITAWYAPALGCEKLQYRVEGPDDNGSQQTLSETKLVNLSIGEPDPRLFEVPENYASVAPSQAMHKEAARLGVTWTDDMQREADRSDAAYFHHLPEKTVPQR